MTDPIPRYAQLDLWMALYGADRSEEYGPFREEHGFAETWARLCGEVRSTVSERDRILGWLNEPPAAETVHACPLDGAYVTGCCGRSPFDLMNGRMTMYPRFVTCGIKSASEEALRAGIKVYVDETWPESDLLHPALRRHSHRHHLLTLLKNDGNRND